MSFRLYPVPESKIDNLRGIVEARLVESNLQGRSDADHCLNSLRMGYYTRTMAAYVDDIQSPKVCLVMAHFPGISTNGVTAHITLIYIDPAQRGNLAAFNVIMGTAENYARLHGADTLAGSSWVYKGSKGIDDLWKRKGFEPQETIYVKQLTQ